jgi:hypothetical protein
LYGLNILTTRMRFPRFIKQVLKGCSSDRVRRCT